MKNSKIKRKKNDKLEKTHYNKLITYHRTIRKLLSNYIKNSDLLLKIEKLENLSKKINKEFSESNYIKKKKEISDENEIKKNFLYMTYHLQNPVPMMEIVYSIFANKNYEFFPSSISNKNDLLILYEKTKKINKKYLNYFFLKAMKNFLSYEFENNILKISGKDWEIKLSISLYSFQNKLSKIFWVILDFELKKKKFIKDEKNEILNTINTVIHFYLQKYNEEDLENFEFYFFYFLIFLLKNILKQKMINNLIYYDPKKIKILDTYIWDKKKINDYNNNYFFRIVLNTKKSNFKFLFKILNLSTKNSLENLDLINFSYNKLIGRELLEIKLKAKFNFFIYQKKIFDLFFNNFFIEEKNFENLTDIFKNINSNINLENIDDFIFNLLEKNELSFIIYLFEKFLDEKKKFFNFEITLLFFHLEKLKNLKKELLQNKKEKFFYDIFSIKNISESKIKPVIFLYNKTDNVLIFLNDIKKCLKKNILFSIKSQNKVKETKNIIYDFIKSQF